MNLTMGTTWAWLEHCDNAHYRFPYKSSPISKEMIESLANHIYALAKEFTQIEPLDSSYREKRKKYVKPYDASKNLYPFTLDIVSLFQSYQAFRSVKYNTVRNEIAMCRRLRNNLRKSLEGTSDDIHSNGRELIVEVRAFLQQRTLIHAVVSKINSNEGKTLISKATFHSLRHTFASEFMRQGGNLYDLQHILGHSTITQTEQYAHFAPSHMIGLTNRVAFAAQTSNVIAMKREANAL